MSLIVKEPDGSSKFPPIEPGTYPGVAYGVVDLGVHHSDKFDKDVRKVLIMWELPQETITTDDGEKPRTISETYSASLSEKAKLRQMLEGWRGRPFTPEELKGFNIAKLLGVGCYINIINVDGKEGKTFAKVQTVTLPVKGAAPIVGSLEKIMFDLDAPGALEQMKNLPEWIQKRIMESTTYADMTRPDPNSYEDVPNEKLPWEQ